MNRLTRLNETTVLLHGRTFEQDGVRRFTWTAAGFTVAFEGTRLIARLETDRGEDPDRLPAIAVCVDGVDAGVRMNITGQGRQLYTLAEELPFGRHMIEVRKLTESGYAYVACDQLETDGRFLPPPEASSRFIEFIGDSITCGFGIDCPLEEAPFRTVEENGMKAYSARTARALAADYSVVAHSGWAVYCSPYGGSIPGCYAATDRVGGMDTLYHYIRHPDVLVLNLGTNDSAWIQTEPVEDAEKDKRKEQFAAAYRQFLKTLRRMHPDAAIVCAIGLIGTLTAEQIPGIVEQALQEGVCNVHFCLLPPTERRSCGHPCDEAHARAAEVLTRAIQDITGWDVADARR